jgi:glycosyltransferase involved in cell wall biosynthesis
MPRSPYDDLVFHKLVINKNIEELNVKILPQGGSLLEIPHKKVSADSFFEYATLIGLTNPLVSFLHQMIYSLSFNNRSFAEFYGASPKSKRLDEFRWYLNYLLQITNALLNGIKLESGFGALVAVNLPSLIAGAIAKHLHGIPLVYEALEYWPESDPDAEQFEIDFWIQLEKLLINYVDYANTVSKGLSKIMSATYGIDFHILPNAPPLTSTNGILKKRHTSKEINFIYQGSFARHRGLEQLIRAFGHKDVDANLKLRGHESKFKSELLSLSKDLGLLNKKVFFLPPVAPEELIDSAMNSGHVGVVPYMPHGKNYSNCSPNKLGQYFAASLPILANKTNFVEEQIVKSGAGIVVDFTKEDELIDAIKTFIDIEKLEKFSTASRAYHEKNFNWEIVSREFYKNISQLVRPSKNPLSSNFSISKQNNSKFIATQKKAYVEASPLTNFIYSLIFSRANLYFYRSLPEPLKKILSPLKRNLIYVYHHKLLKK